MIGKHKIRIYSEIQNEYVAKLYHLIGLFYYEIFQKKPRIINRWNHLITIFILKPLRIGEATIGKEVGKHTEAARFVIQSANLGLELFILR